MARSVLSTAPMMGEKGVGGGGEGGGGQIISFLIFSILCCIAVVPLLFFAATSLHGQVSTLYCSHDGGKGGRGWGEGGGGRLSVS